MVPRCLQIKDKTPSECGTNGLSSFFFHGLIPNLHFS